MTLKQLGYGALVGVTAVFIALGSATTAEAAKKSKKAAAAPAQSYGFCTLQTRSAVCATRGTTKLSYANACFAQADGAKGAKAGACKASKAAKKGGGKKKMAKAKGGKKKKQM
jgi:hypothetical protein